MIVRPFVAEDVEWAITTSITSIEEDRNEPDLIDTAQMEMIATLAVKQGSAVVCEAATGRVGLLGGLILPNPLCPSKSVLTSVLWYVHPEYRKGRVPYLLLREYAKLHPTGDVLLSVPTRSHIKESSLVRLGWELVEKQYKIRK